MATNVSISRWNAAFSALSAVLAAAALATVGYVAATLGAHGERLEQAVRERAAIQDRFGAMETRFDRLDESVRSLDRTIRAQQASVHDILASLGVIPFDWPDIETVVIGQDIYMFPKTEAQFRLLQTRGFELAQIRDATLSGFRVGPIDMVLPDAQP